MVKVAFIGERMLSQQSCQSVCCFVISCISVLRSRGKGLGKQGSLLLSGDRRFRFSRGAFYVHSGRYVLRIDIMVVGVRLDRVDWVRLLRFYLADSRRDFLI